MKEHGRSLRLDDDAERKLLAAANGCKWRTRTRDPFQDVVILMKGRPTTADEITELLNRDLGPGDQPFQAREVTNWLRNADDTVLQLYWLESRPQVVFRVFGCPTARVNGLIYHYQCRTTPNRRDF